ncbi:MAG: diphosphomevalonate decarboxylase [Saprospiraceae bacterium]
MDLIIPQQELDAGEIAWRSPANIAITKYWGKFADQQPRNASISLTLNNATTTSVLTFTPKAVETDEISLQLFFEEQANPKFTEKVQKYFAKLLPIFPFLKQFDFTVHTKNSFPHSAGIASSASSMSALSLCLCSMEEHFFGKTLSDFDFDKKASYIARLGSGSACRSIYPIAALWGKIDGIDITSNDFALPLEGHVHPVFMDMHDAILMVSKAEKSVSSSVGHALMDNNEYAPARFEQAQKHNLFLLKALEEGDIKIFGNIAEREALSLHALMMTSEPPFLLMQPNSLAIIEKIRAYRKDTQHDIYFTLDAGPNIHLLYPDDIVTSVESFIKSDLAPFCEGGEWLADYVGEGPEQV